ncbi:MAG: carbohydrate-binding protein [Clostridia bacterium]
MKITVNDVILKNVNNLWEYDKPFAEGDIIEIFADTNYIKLKIDKTLNSSIVYLPKKHMRYEIPFGEQLTAYPPNAFSDIPHIIECREASEEEVNEYRNLALNSADRRRSVNCFPHSAANFVTKDLPYFESRNAIDGVCQNSGHGLYPYHSWGGGDRDDLEYYLDFGRNVLIDKIVLYLRADYSENEQGELHDTYWKHITVKFSDNTELELSPLKTKKAQVFTFNQKKVSGLTLYNLVRDRSFPNRGFAALSQIEVYGKDEI